MLSFETTTQIAADPAHVWATLVQTDRWSSWDPALDRVEGPLAGLITKRIPDLQPSFDAFAAGLRTAAEASA